MRGVEAGERLWLGSKKDTVGFVKQQVFHPRFRVSSTPSPQCTYDESKPVSPPTSTKFENENKPVPYLTLLTGRNPPSCRLQTAAPFHATALPPP